MRTDQAPSLPHALPHSDRIHQKLLQIGTFQVAGARSRKPVRVFRSDEGSNPSLSVSRQVAGLSSPRPTRGSPTSTGVSGSDFPATSPRPPLVHPRSTRAWPRSVRRSQDRRIRVLLRSQQRRDTPPLLEGSTRERSPARAPQGCYAGAHFPATAPSSSLCVTCWLVTHSEPVPNTGAQRYTPELPEVRREGFLRVSEQAGTQLHAHVLTEGDA